MDDDRRWFPEGARLEERGGNTDARLGVDLQHLCPDTVTFVGFLQARSRRCTVSGDIKAGASRDDFRERGALGCRVL